MEKKNPYITENDKIGTATDLKKEQGDDIVVDNNYYPEPNETPYDIMMKKASMNLATNSQAQPQVKGANVNANSGMYPSLNNSPNQVGYSPQAPPMQQTANAQYQNRQNFPPPPKKVPNMPMYITQAQHIRSTPCPHCHAGGVPVIEKKRVGTAVWGWCCALLCITGCLCWIPFIMNDCYDHQFICTNCNKVRGFVRSQFCC